MNKILRVSAFLILLSFSALAQQATIKGRIINSKTNETLPGVNVLLNETAGVVSDLDGNYIIKTAPGKIRLVYKYIGFTTVTKHFDLKASEEITADVAMDEESLMIEGVVVSAGKFEQKLSDVTISMEVLKPDQIESQNTNDMSEALNKIPGMAIYDGQPSIRGGSGYSYGAGSRVLLLVDDLPILSPDAGDAKWNFIPVENISQVEVLKGASSALFGSSALNGVINIRTAYPTNKPVTKFLINSGIYMNPKREELIWWGSTNPMFTGSSFFHSRMIGNFDLVVGANVFQDAGFRENEGEARARINSNMRYRFKKVEGLSTGLNVNYMYQDKTDFFLWQNDSSGAYRQNPSTITKNKGYRVNVDPFITYFSKKGRKYSLRMRYFRQTNIFEDDRTKDNIADMYYGEYQYHRNFKDKINWTAGVSGSYGVSTAQLFGSHTGVNASFFTQFDAKIRKKLSVSLGVRAEYFRIDTAESVSSYAVYFSKDTLTLPVWPVFRFGLNYPLAKYTFIRASYGQGYRFPTIAEKFISTSIGGLNIFPNTQLKPETGWSAEVGIKQGVKLGAWNGYLDLAGFWTEYVNMMEFTFGIYDTDSVLTLEDVGFKSLNVGHARITGLDFTFTGAGNVLGFPATILCGYTYTNPIDLNYDPNTDTLGTTNSRILKYRYYHSVKADFEVTFGRVVGGIGFSYTSHMINIDKAFEGPLIDGYAASTLLPGLKEYREKHNKGYYVFDLRIGYDITETSKISLVVKNLLNEEYMTRPGFIEAPRNLALQYSMSF